MANRRYWVETYRYSGGYAWRIVSATEAFGVVIKQGKTYKTRTTARLLGQKALEEFRKWRNLENES